MAREQVVTLSTDKTVSLGKDAKYVEGFYIGSKQVPSKMAKSGFQTVHILRGEAGNIGVWGFFALNDALSCVKPGTMTFVTYKGKINLKGGKTQHTCLVEQDKDITTFVPQNVSSDFDNASEPEGASDEEAFGSDEPQFEEAELEASDIDEDAPPVHRAPPVIAKASPSTVSAEQQRRAMDLLNKARAKKTA